MKRFLSIFVCAFVFVGTMPAQPMEWRGIMIDVSRHFLPIDYLYKEVDAMERFGLNKLHLHLTDAAGWRLEIKSRPRLTEIGAWRSAPLWKDWWNGDRKYSDRENGFGGYYTQSQMHSLIDYAQKKGIDIIPEIEFPAHSEEAVAAYPEIGYNHAEMDMAKEETYAFMRDVLTEVAALFPSHYIHVGGDEATTQHGLQPEGMRRVKEIADSLGKRMIVWDEALTDEPSDSDMIIMVWRNIGTAQKAMQLGHPAILCPGKYCYLDKAQDAPTTQPKAAGGYLPIDSVYALPLFNNQKLLGLQANVWTEHIETPEYMEYMLWPRAFAIAEIGREGFTEDSDIQAFHQRALEATKILRDSLHINAFNLAQEVGERKIVVQNSPSTSSGTKCRVKSSLHYNTKPHSAYPGSSEECLIDGIFGGWNNTDGKWQGFIGRGGMDVTLDLGRKTTVRSIMGDFMQSTGPEIFFPFRIKISVSDDGSHYTLLSDKSYPDIYCTQPEDYRQLGWQGRVKTQFIRLQAFPGDRGGWIFCSEVFAKK